MIGISISRLSNFRMPALAAAVSLAISALGCGRQDKKDIGTIQTVSYAEAMKKCPDKVRQSLIFTENFSTNRFVPLMVPAIKITNGDLLFTEDSLCVPVKQEPKVAPLTSASASAPAPTVSAPIPGASASAAAAVSSTVKTVSSTSKVPAVPASTTTKGGFRPQ
ncbi:MAG: hypothetical protein WC624_06985 [Candidatus Margulisiibacteriota bacterium]